MLGKAWSERDGNWSGVLGCGSVREVVALGNQSEGDNFRPCCIKVVTWGCMRVRVRVRGLDTAGRSG